MLEIRQAEPDDAAQILALCKVVGGESGNLTFGPEGLPFTVEQEQAFLSATRKAEKQAMFVAVQDGEIIGTASLSVNERTRLSHRGELALMVQKAFWGQHIGTRLLEALLRYARDTARLEIVSLEVRTDNVRAITLYNKLGFVKIGTFDGYLKVDGQDVSCDIMRLAL